VISPMTPAPRFPPPPSVIPYGGFSPVRLSNRRFPPRTFRTRRNTRRVLIRGATVRLPRCQRVAPLRGNHRSKAAGWAAGWGGTVVDPEALGFASGFMFVPPGSSLTMASSEASTSHPAAYLFFRPAGAWGAQRVPTFNLPVLPSVPVCLTPVDSGGLSAVVAPPMLAFGRHPIGSASNVTGPKDGSRPGRVNEAAQVTTLCCGPGSCCSPFTDKGFLLSSFSFHESTSPETSTITTRGKTAKSPRGRTLHQLEQAALVGLRRMNHR